MTDIAAARDEVLRRARWTFPYEMTQLDAEEAAGRIYDVALDLVPRNQRTLPVLMSLSTTPGHEAVATRLAPLLAPIEWVERAGSDPRLVEEVRQLQTDLVDGIRSRHAVSCHLRRARVAVSDDEARRVLRSVLDGEAAGLMRPETPERVTAVLFDVAEVAIGRGHDNIAWEVLERAIAHDNWAVLKFTRRALANAALLPVWRVSSDRLAGLLEDRDLLVVVRPGPAADALDQYRAARAIAEAIRRTGRTATPLCLWHRMVTTMNVPGLSADGQKHDATWRPGAGIGFDTSLMSDPPPGHPQGPLPAIDPTDADTLLAMGMLLPAKPRAPATVEAFPSSRPGDCGALLVRGTDPDLGATWEWESVAPAELGERDPQ